jgi:pilus assembly protein CpaE
MTIIVERDVARAEPLQAALGGTIVVLDSLEAARRRLADDFNEDVVVIGADVDLQAAVAFTEGFRLTRPTLGVILVRRRVESSVLSDALYAGMRDVVEERDLTGVTRAVDRAKRTAAAIRDQGVLSPEEVHRRRGTVVTVFSAKGGTGKTTLSTNLAAALAENGRRRVCLVDLDLGFGDVGITMQLFPSRTIADAIGAGAVVEDETLDSLLAPHSPGLDVIVAPVAPDEKEKISPDVVSAVIDGLARRYDFVVIDTAPSLDELAVSAFDRTDVLLLLATLDIPAVKNLKLTLEMLDLLDYPRKQRHVVLNRADAKVVLTAEETERSLKTEIEVRLPSSRDVPASVNRGTLIVLDNPRHPVSQEIRALAQRLVAQGSAGAGEAADTPSSETPPPGRGRFRRRRSS